MKIIQWLKGKKAYAIMTAAIVVAGLVTAGITIPDWA